MTASCLNSSLAQLGSERQRGQAPAPAAGCSVVAAAQGGCPDAFRTLVETYQDTIYHFCYRYLRDSNDAQEVCQDVFVRAHGALARFDARDPIKPWLYRIALNRCHDHARQRKSARSKKTFALDNIRDRVRCPLPRPDSAAEHGEDLAKLDRGLRALSKRSRAVIVLTCLDGFTHAECAEVLGCSERGVEGRLYRARNQLATWWERDIS